MANKTVGAATSLLLPSTNVSAVTNLLLRAFASQDPEKIPKIPQKQVESPKASDMKLTLGCFPDKIFWKIFKFEDIKIFSLFYLQLNKLLVKFLASKEKERRC